MPSGSRRSLSGPGGVSQRGRGGWVSVAASRFEVEYSGSSGAVRGPCTLQVRLGAPHARREFETSGPAPVHKVPPPLSLDSQQR